MLDTVINQQTDWSFEVLVIDFGSTDSTVDLIKRYSSVRLIEISATEFGHGKIRNFAIAHTKGDYIAGMPFPHWLAELVNAIEMDTRIAGVFGRHIAYPDASPFTGRISWTQEAKELADQLTAIRISREINRAPLGSCSV